MARDFTSAEKKASSDRITFGNSNYPQGPKGKTPSSIGDQFEFRVIANAGDPGLSEDTYHDILSRFIICMAEPAERCICETGKRQLLYLIRRPRHLWINHEGKAEVKNFHQQRRRDALGNINVGKSGDWSIQTIPKMNKPYRIGDKITAKKIETQNVLNSDFVSAWTSDIFTRIYSPFGSGDVLDEEFNIAYSSGDEFKNHLYTDGYWRDYGAFPPSTVSPGSKQKPRYDGLRQHKPLCSVTKGLYIGPSSEGNATYPGGNEKYTPIPSKNSLAFLLHVYMLDHSLALMNPSQADVLSQLNNKSHEFQHLLDGKNGYIRLGTRFTSVHFEDINKEERQRVSTDECMPLVIASPNNFPTPRKREIGAILYSPAYSKVVIANPNGNSPAPPQSTRTINIKFHHLDNGLSPEQAPLGSKYDIDFQKHVDHLNLLFSSNVPDTKIRFAWDGSVSRVLIPLGRIFAKDESQSSILQLSPAIEQTKYLNMWFAPQAGLSYSSFPPSHGVAGDGIVLSVLHWLIPPRDNDDLNFRHFNTIAHEVGHYLGLKHIWGNSNDCDADLDDGIDDTPLQAKALTSCDTVMACDGITPALVNNLMNYTPDACKNNFTQGQVDRMNATLSTVRASLVA